MITGHSVWWDAIRSLFPSLPESLLCSPAWPGIQRSACLCLSSAEIKSVYPAVLGLLNSNLHCSHLHKICSKTETIMNERGLMESYLLFPP